MPDTPTGDQIFDAFPTATFVIDDNQKITKANNAAEKLFSSSIKKLMGRSLSDFVNFEDIRLQNAFASKDSDISSRNTKIVIKPDESLIGDIFINYLSTDTKHRLVIISPVTARNDRHSQESRKSSYLTSRSPDILSHELKNPLAAIKGAAQLLERGLSQQETKLTDIIQNEVERITGLLNHMQYLANNEPSPVEPTNIHKLIFQCQASVKLAIQPNAQIIEDFDPSLPQALVNPDSMIQILTNLLRNAFEAVVEVEKPEISIRTRYSLGESYSRQMEGGAVKLPIEIIIRDNGPGVASDLESELYAPFVSTKKGGQGLGLSLVRKLIGDMGGQIRYERINDTGHTHFTLSLPVARLVK